MSKFRTNIFWPQSWAVLGTAFSQWGFPLLLDFLSDIWISLWCNNHDAIIFYIWYIILSIPVCSLLLDFLSDIWISLWCNNFLYQVYNPVYSCLILSDPVCSSVPVCSWYRIKKEKRRKVEERKGENKGWHLKNSFISPLFLLYAFFYFFRPPLFSIAVM